MIFNHTFYPFSGKAATRSTRYQPQQQNRNYDNKSRSRSNSSSSTPISTSRSITRDSSMERKDTNRYKNIFLFLDINESNRLLNTLYIFTHGNTSLTLADVNFYINQRCWGGGRQTFFKEGDIFCYAYGPDTN